MVDNTRKLKPLNQELWNKFRDHLDAPGGPTLNSISKAIGWSNSVVSLYKSGTYSGDVHALEFDIACYLVRLKERESAPKVRADFVNTTVAARIYEVAYMAHIEGEIAVLTGRAGVGKTEGAKKFASDNTDVIYICAISSFTARIIFKRILSALGDLRHATLQNLFDLCKAKLENSGRMIIVDQAEYLPNTALEMLRSLHDETGVGLLLIGLPKLYHNLRQEGGQHEQIYSRVGIYHNLDQAMTPEDAQMLFRSMTGSETQFPGLDTLCRKNARVLQKLVRRGQSIAANHEKPLDLECLQAASKYLMF